MTTKSVKKKGSTSFSISSKDLSEEDKKRFLRILATLNILYITIIIFITFLGIFIQKTLNLPPAFVSIVLIFFYLKMSIGLFILVILNTIFLGKFYALLIVIVKGLIFYFYILRNPLPKPEGDYTASNPFIPVKDGMYSFNQGFSGIPGNQGISGNQGFSGIPGNQGISGNQGFSGIPGNQGVSPVVSK